MKKPSLVFFGTGPVAAKSLELIMSDFDIEAVVTKPQPAHHKEDFPVTSLAQKRGLKILEINNKLELSELFKKERFGSKAGLVIDFGIIIGNNVLEYFPLGIINSHFSMLPEWRGPDPITFCLLSGQKATGVSIMIVSEKMDEGELIAQTEYAIPEKINIQRLTSDLIDLSDKTLKEYLPKYLEGKIRPYPQDPNLTPTYSKLLTKADGIVDLSKPAEVLEREVRAYFGWPGSKLKLELKDGKELQIIITDSQVEKPIGTQTEQVLTADRRFMVKTSEDYLEILKLKLPGKSEMTASEFLNGYRTNFQ